MTAYKDNPKDVKFRRQDPGKIFIWKTEKKMENTGKVYLMKRGCKDKSNSGSGGSSSSNSSSSSY
jgi:hypothetical protein